MLLGGVGHAFLRGEWGVIANGVAMRRERRAAAAENRRQAIALLLLLAVVAAPQSTDGVTISSVLPNRGSMAGGTRLHIKGAGFSTNTGGTGNVIKIGDKYFCDPIPLHCTTSQIACKTRSALEGLVSEWTGWTDWMLVTVIVDGKESVCTGSCQYSYHYGWYHTPRIYNLFPRAVAEGTILTVDGRFHKAPFDFDELRAPSQEVPLLSVKVANREGEGQSPENEPFGQSGTRCALFDADIEEPYGLVYNEEKLWNGNLRYPDQVDQFKCQIYGPREGGRYNLSVALLGSAMIPEESMNMGEAQVANTNYQADHNGVTFMMQTLPVIESVTPTRSGHLGGTRITIKGQSLSIRKEIIKVSVSGIPCHVETSSPDLIECVLAPYSAAASYPQGTLQPGARGARRRLWMGQGRQDWDTFPDPERKADIDDIETSLLEMPTNARTLFSDFNEGPFGYFDGFFRAPKRGNYTFIVAFNQLARVWIRKDKQNGYSTREQIISSNVSHSFVVAYYVVKVIWEAVLVTSFVYIHVTGLQRRSRLFSRVHRQRQASPPRCPPCLG